MALEDIFDFTADDLASNSKGQLTTRQQELIKTYRTVSNRGIMVSFIAVIGSFGVMALILLLGLNRLSPLPSEAIIVVGGMFGLVISIFLIFWLWGIYRARYIRTPRVFDVTGQAHPYFKKRQYYTEYHVSIGKIRFQIQSENQYNAIRADQTYRVHYIHYPPTHIILSIAAL